MYLMRSDSGSRNRDRSRNLGVANDFESRRFLREY